MVSLAVISELASFSELPLLALGPVFACNVNGVGSLSGSVAVKSNVGAGTNVNVCLSMRTLFGGCALSMGGSISSLPRFSHFVLSLSGNLLNLYLGGASAG